MKKIATLAGMTLLALSLFFPTVLQAQPKAPAFPGAEGFGAFVTGGRGGAVVYVTNLDDSGPGSFRWACEDKSQPTPRIIMFQIGGTIELKSDVALSASNVTIAGQSAPGGGICLKNYQFRISGSNVIVRHMRFRSGEMAKKEQMSLRLSGAHDIMLDHCSATWAVDECLTSSSLYNATFQNTIIGEGLNNAGVHPKGDHSHGSLLNSRGGVSIIHSMYTTNNNRNPRAYNMLLDMRNCVVYNWGAMAYTSEYCAMVNMVDNYLLPGPATRNNATTFFKAGNLQTRVFIDGNVVINKNDNNVNEEYTAHNSKGVVANPWMPALIMTDKDVATTVLVKKPHPAPKLQNWKDPRTELFAFVMDNVGATLPKRDAADARIVNNARNRTGKIVDAVMPNGDKYTIGGWPTLEAGTPVVDTDGDGMPDAWEKQYGFNPNDPSDGPADRDGDGYTNLEEYLNGTNPTKAEPASKLKWEDVKALQDNALEAIEELRAEYSAAMAEIESGKDNIVQDQIDALKGHFRFEPALSTKPQRVAVYLTEPGKKEQLFMYMVRVPKGTFWMGMSDYEANLGAGNLPDNALSRELPRHQVTLTKDYYMAEVATTKEQFAILMKQSYPKGEAKIPHGTTWTEAKRMAKILAGATGEPFRLPTEAQWERACRAGTETAFFFGDKISSDQANLDAAAASPFNDSGKYRKKGIDAYTLPANAYGLYGMHGNGYEYCEDLEGYRYPAGPVTDPLYKPDTDGTHVLRGGSMKSTAMYCRSASRYQYKDRVNFGSRMVMMAE